MNKQDTAKALAQAHFEVEPQLKRVFVLKPINGNDQNEPIALLEVVEGMIERGIEPIAFTAVPPSEFGSSVRCRRCP